ncbi:MAG: protein phosphatase 2C domain-containing protein [Christensenellales bacterium]
MAATMRTDIGRKRKQNEDAAWFDEKRGVFVVADGMGGHLAGEVASQMAIDAVRRMAARHKKPSVDLLKKTVLGAHERIYLHAQGHAECAGMGTTISMMWRGGGYMYIAHVGDSRIYRLRDGPMEQITQDHSLVGELVRAGLLTPEEARLHPRRNIITRARHGGGQHPRSAGGGFAAWRPLSALHRRPDGHDARRRDRKNAP